MSSIPIFFQILDFPELGDVFSSKQLDCFLESIITQTIAPKFISISNEKTRSIESRIQILEKITNFLLFPNFGIDRSVALGQKDEITRLFRKIINYLNKILQDLPKANQENLEKTCLTILENISFAPEKRYFVIKACEFWGKLNSGYFTQAVLKKTKKPDVLKRILKILCSNTCYSNDRGKHLFRTLIHDENCKAAAVLFPLFFEFLMKTSEIELLREICEMISVMLNASSYNRWYKNKTFDKKIRLRLYELSNFEDPIIKRISNEFVSCFLFFF